MTRHIRSIARPARRLPVAALLALGTLSVAGTVHAQDRWYLDFAGGFTDLDVSTVTVTPEAGGAYSSPLDSGSGYGLGGAFGRELGANWRVEAELRYRTNDASGVILADGSQAIDGDYSSLILAANGYYLFGGSEDRWRPYIGAGLGWLQEIDIDLDTPDARSSWSGDGSAWQLMGGALWALSERWEFEFEARYTDAGSIDLTLEEGPAGGRIGADYTVWSLSAAAVFRF